MKRMACLAFALAGLAPLAVRAQDAEDTCLLFVCSNISTGGGNLYLYHQISDQKIEIQQGDVLEYDLFLYSKQPGAFGGVELGFTDGSNLRDSGAVDQNGLGSHGGSPITHALGKWFSRRVDLNGRVGRTTQQWLLQVEGDSPGTYIQCVDNVAIRRADGTHVPVYQNGHPRTNRVGWKEGFSQQTVLQPIPRASVKDDRALEAILESEIRSVLVEQLAVEYQAEIERMKQYVNLAGRTDVLTALDRAKREVPDAKAFTGSTDAYRALLVEARRKLSPAHDVMRQYTGHIIGHAHIDLQWLWEWSETVQVCKDTFGQAVRFMEEYPGFTFNQSSPCLYKVTEEHDPALFAKMRDRVKKGQWEIAGGRWCEGDTNMPSGESQARHFLLGQRYFRRVFGMDAKVGWEPDTFGHSWQMPQLLRLAGIQDYYFCRGGKDIPLFHWEGIDGSRVLAFQESATGTWYNGDIGPKQAQEALDFRKGTGSFHSLWVYGVGNHGGGPTRENIHNVLDWQKDPLRPLATFSTATAWFQAVRAEKELKELPVVRDEMNTDSHNGFWGCLTTHGNVKRWNRDAEALTVQAETAAAIASRSGFRYPKETFRRSWEDILWNHHHDTLTGTSIHPSYFLTEQVFERAIAASRRTLGDAVEHIAARVRLPEALAAHARPNPSTLSGQGGEGRAVLVFNTLGWRRDAVVEIENDTSFYPPSGLVAVAPSGESTPVQYSGERRYLFLAKDLPACGYRVYVIRPRPEGESPAAKDMVRGKGAVLAGGRFEVHVDAASGAVTRLTDRKLGRDWIVPERPGNRLVAYLEKPHGMSAWVIGGFAGSEEPEPVRVLRQPKSDTWEDGPVRAAVHIERRYRRSTIHQKVMVYKDLDRIDFALDVEWHEKGGDGKPSPFLKVEFPFNVPDAQPRYEIPFGDIARNAPGREVPALQWADIGGDGGGIALLNDCKYGHSAEKDGTLRLSLIRSSYEPDPEPDLGRHVIRYALYPHAGGVHEAEVTRRGFEFNHKAVAVWLDQVGGGFGPRSAEADGPAEKSFLDVTGDGVLATALKVAEDGDDWVVRFYQSSGKPAAAKVTSAFGVRAAQAVNLVEDPLGETVNLESVPLRGYEIKTLKLKVE